MHFVAGEEPGNEANCTLHLRTLHLRSLEIDKQFVVKRIVLNIQIVTSYLKVGVDGIKCLGVFRQLGKDMSLDPMSK